MDKSVQVSLHDDIHLDCFKFLFRKYKAFQSCYREIKINSINGKKSEFEISEINPPIICGFEYWSNLSYGNMRIKDSCFIINRLEMVVSDKLIILNINLKIKILDTEKGKLLQEILDQVEFKVIPLYKSDKIVEISGFYVTSSLKQSA